MVVSVNAIKNLFDKGGIRIVKTFSSKEAYNGDSRWRWKRKLIKDPLAISGGINPHVAIVGESGSGKSNACKAMILALHRKGCRFAVLDPHNEYIGMANQINANVHNCAHSGINIFELDGISPRERCSELVTMLRRHFRLGYYQGSMLHRCLSYMYKYPSVYSPSLQSLVRVIIAFKKNGSAREIGALQTLQERLLMIQSGSVRDSIGMDQVFDSNNIFALSGLHTAESQAIFIEGFLRKAYSTMLSRRRGKERMLYIIVEEAGKLGECEVLKRMVSEGRKYNIGIIAVAQGAKGLDREVRINSSLFLSFYQREPEELNYVSNFIAGGNEGHRFVEVKKALRKLPCDHALVLSHNLKEPVIARFPPIRFGRENLEYSIKELTRDGIRRGELLRKLYSTGFYYNEVCRTVNRLLEEKKLNQHEVQGCGAYDGIWYISNNVYSPEHDVSVELIEEADADGSAQQGVQQGERA